MDTAIERRDATSGVAPLNTISRRIIMNAIDMTETMPISLTALFEVLWLLKGTPEYAKRMPSFSSGLHTLYIDVTPLSLLAMAEPSLVRIPLMKMYHLPSFSEASTPSFVVIVAPAF